MPPIKTAATATIAISAEYFTSNSRNASFVVVYDENTNRIFSLIKLKQFSQ